MPPLLDFAALQSTPLRPAVTLSGLEHPRFPEILAAVLPGVRHSRTSRFPERDEHSLVDVASGSAVRIVIDWDRLAGRARTRIAEIGPRRLWDELVGCLSEWEAHGRCFPEHWQDGARAALLISHQDEFHLDGLHIQIGRLEGGPTHRRQEHVAAFEPKVPHLVPTRPIAASELDLGVYDKLDDLVTGQDHGVLALLAGQHKCSAAAVKGPKRPRRRQERRWEAQDSPGGRDLAAVLAFAAHLHDLAGRGHLTRLLLRRADE